MSLSKGNNKQSYVLRLFVDNFVQYMSICLVDIFARICVHE